MAALFPFQMNGPVWPDAQPWDTYVFLAAAAFVVPVNRRAMLTRDGAVTQVLMPGEVPPPDAVPRAADLRPSAR